MIEQGTEYGDAIEQLDKRVERLEDGFKEIVSTLASITESLEALQEGSEVNRDALNKMMGFIEYHDSQIRKLKGLKYK